MFETAKKTLHGAGLRTTTALSRFRRDEDGSMVIFSLFIFLVMIIMGGLAIDLMRAENLRTTTQNTLDRAVLAAANTENLAGIPVGEGEDAALLVATDYLVKSGLPESAFEVESLPTKRNGELLSQSVSISTKLQMPTYFMGLTGVDVLPVPASSSASEGITELEISLVLDISGSMGWGNKMPELKSAATKFINQVMDAADANSAAYSSDDDATSSNVTMSLIPYATQVNVGPLLEPILVNRYGMTQEHSYSACVDFAAADFNSVTLLEGGILQRSGHFDPWSREWEGRVKAADGGSWTDNYPCRLEPHAMIQPWSNTPRDLTDQIDDLQAGGFTSIDVGARWGAILLDPSSADIYDDLVFSGQRGNAATETGLLPAPYGGSDTDLRVDKYMIIMTDGINTTQYTIDDDYRSGPSGIWLDPDSGRYSRMIKEEDSSGNPIDIDGDGVSGGVTYWLADEYGADYASEYSIEVYDEDENGEKATADNANAYELDWTEVFNNMSLRDWAYSFYYEQGNDDAARDDALNGAQANILAPTKEIRLDQICRKARANGITIFTIGFEVTDASAKVMEKCANPSTGESNFFYRVGDDQAQDIDFAFQSIANTIGRLKLTQ
ncbi:MAG: TadE/TadG family type IV pilus assembly protein [Pseudomonadota bacterium]